MLPTELVYQNPDGVFFKFCIADKICILDDRVIDIDNIGDRRGETRTV